MLVVLGCLCGIFVGLTTSWYFQIKPIAEKNAKILQLENENDDLRHEKEDLQEDLSTAYKEIEMKDKTIQLFISEIERNDYNRTDLHLKKLKELADDYQSQN